MFLALFLDSVAKVIEMDTSEILPGHPHKFQSVCDEYQGNIRKYIEVKE